GFRVFFSDAQLDVPFGREKLEQLFEKIEKGSSQSLRKFLDSARYKYEVGMKDLVYKPGLSIVEFMNLKVLGGVFKLDLISSFDKYVAAHFKDERLRQLMEFPILFLGAAPAKTPALYSLMNYAGLELGTWYPKGGMHMIIQGMAALARELGVKIHTGSNCEGINVDKGEIRSVTVSGEKIETDGVISSADYHFTEQKLLAEEFRNYSSAYWRSRTLAPSSLIFYLGIEGKIDNLLHHNLFFDEDLGQHTKEIYEFPRWPSKPLFYLCCPSKTDASVAPGNSENLFILMPLAAGLDDSQEMREKYFDIIIKRIEKRSGNQFRDRIKVKDSYCLQNFIDDYGAFKGNAYGLANTLNQTAIFKPSIRNKKVQNLYYTGHLTVPGPGVPPSIISGKLVADQIIKSISHESLV
ncbi:MAG: phytoene desaturase, partial [Saprospiraceae bacterium]|nr:phytoene desaturase [Saprospiraceae bacterium]